MSDRRLDLSPVVFRFGLAGGTVWLVFWSLVTLIFDIVLLCGIGWQVAALRYEPVVGVVTLSRVDGASDSTRPDIHYSYTVNGVNYNGDRYRCWTVATNDGNAERVVAAHPVGQKVTVYYNPADPSASVLRRGIEGSDLFLAIFLTPFNIVMLGGWCWAAKGYRRLRGNAPFGGLPVTWCDERLRIRLDDTRLGCPAAIALVLSFILIFVLGFTVGFNPPMPLMLGIWAAIIGLCALTYWWDPLTGPARAVVLDNLFRSLEIYRRSRGAADLIIPASSVRDVTVVATERPDGEGGVHRTYAATLVYTQADGSEGRQTLREGSDERLAEGLVEGIGEWLCAGVNQPARSEAIQTAASSSVRA
jgi:hypothetical protein